MKRRFENLLAMFLSLLISAVWIPTFWVLLQLPWTWDGEKSSAFLHYVDQELGTVSYQITSVNGKGERCEPEATKPREHDNNWLPCDTNLNTKPADSFAGLALLTLVIFGIKYALSGRVSLKLIKEEETDNDK